MDQYWRAKAVASSLKGACEWKGSEMARSDRWVKEVSAQVADEIDRAVAKTETVDWRRINRENFLLPEAAAFFADVREELENGSGMVKIRGLEVGRYNEAQLRR